MIRWEELDSQSQIYLYWEYCAATPETDLISFQEYDELMTGFIFE